MSKSKNVERYTLIFRRISVERLAVSIAVFSALILVLSYSYYYKLIVDFHPLNGSFQTFNPIRRILAGEIPGQDFNPYLGVGITYLTGLLTAVWGGDFSASQFTIYSIHLVCHFFNLFVLAYLCEFSVRRSLLLASGITVVTTSLLITWQFAGHRIFNSFFRFLELPLIPDSLFDYSWRELVTPSGSNLGLRSSLPFLVSGVLLMVLPRFQDHPRWLSIVIGAIAGVLPFWSNDYGIPSGLLLLLFSAIYLSKKKLTLIVPGLISVGLSSLISFALVGSIATHGHLIDWITENFVSVAGDQFWYFNTAKYKAFNLTDIIPESYLYLYGIGLVAFLLYIVCFREFNQRYWLLAYIGLTTFSAGMISSVGGGSGKPFLRYYFPAIFVSYFILPKCLSIAGQVILSVSQESSLVQKGKMINRILLTYKRRLKTAIALLTIVFLAAVLSYSYSYPIFETPSPPRYFYVPETGGWLPPAFKTAVAEAYVLREKLKDIPPKQRITSTYSTLIDLIVGSKNPAGADYIIHALGEQARQQYISEFRENPPEYITTLREEFTNWETWVRRVDWWLYREFINTYDPINATFYNVTWKRRTQPKIVEYPVASCQLERKSDSAMYLTITTQSPISKNPSFATGTSHFVDLALNYSLTVKSSGVPFLGSRGLVNISELKVASLKSVGVIDNHQYGLPPRHSDWHIPVEHRLGETSVLELVGYPKERAIVEVSGCQAQLVAPVKSFEVVQQRLAKNVTDENWKNGILTARFEQNPNLQSEAAFIIADPNSDYVLNAGGAVEFAQSGKRKIVEVSGEQVFVQGAALDPVKDGYPNPITFTLK